MDSLYLSYAGALTGTWAEKLSLAKDLAKSSDVTEQAEANLQLVDHVFQVHSVGKGRFPYVLSDNWYHIQVSSASAETLPLAYCQISSELLSKAGIAASARALTNVAFCLGAESPSPSVSRLDLCVDFVTDHPLELIADEHCVTRARSIARRSSNRKFCGITVGEGGDLSCRLYDKTLEIEQKSKKTFFFEIWARDGWDGRSPVWRLEFQFRRSVLKQLGIDKLDHLEEKLNSLWRYATCKWLRLACPTSDSNQTRWPTHPLWAELSQATFSSDAVVPLSRVTKCRIPSDQYLFQAGLGAITSFMAREGLTDIDAAMPAFVRYAHAYHRTRSSLTGEDLPRYAKVRAANKAKRFNTIRAESTTTAEDYSRAKGGELGVD